jgi:hypothetical protein
MAPPTRSATTRVGRVVSHAHGPLRHLLLWFPREAAVRRGYREVYADLLATLPATTRLTVLVHPGAAEVLTELLDRAERRATTTVVSSGDHLRFSVWAQDPCLILQGDDGWRLSVPSRFDRQQDARAVEVVAEAIGAEVLPSGLDVHGGDVLAGDDFVMVGRHGLDATVAMLADDREAAASGADPRAMALERLTDLLAGDRRLLVVGTRRALPEHRTRTIELGGRDVVEVMPGGGGSPHPLIHLDMFLTLAGRGPEGRYRILVGSPALADELLGRAAVDGPLAQLLDDVAAQLVAEGFEVVRNPLPLTYGDGCREIDGERCDVRLWYLATSNNCLVQIDRHEGDQVWLPTYGHGAWRALAATDAANRGIWEQLGFRVHELTSFHTFVQRFGALHCIAKELDRSAGPETRTGPAQRVGVNGATDDGAAPT